MKRCANLPIVSIVSLLLGMFLLTDFYTHLNLGHFTTWGFSEQLHALARLDNAPPFWKEGLLWAAKHSLFFTNFVAPLLAITAASLILQFAKSFFLWIAAAIFAVYWVSNWAYPGIWIFEFLFPFAFALCAAAASLKEHILGTKIFGGLSLFWRFAIVLLSSAALGYVIILGDNGGGKTFIIAWQTALTFALLLGLSTFVDGLREKHQESAWVSIMVLIIGAMMVLQVFADQAVGFYTTEGYAQLVNSYAKQSNAPAWFRNFLSWSADHAALFMPLQALFEALAAILLSLLVLRGPALFLTTLMFLLFTYAEFGVKAELPSSPIHTLTNTWELLFVTIVALFISLKQTGDLVEAPTWRQKLLGPKLFGNSGLFWKLMISLLAGVALFAAGVKTHVFSEHYFRTSLLGGISFALLLFINALLDRLRGPQSRSS